ncbi:MAG: S8 family serine peptidase [Lactobacillales bacterium]|jgi:lactocepin|nr:S8 family serine peptidase [Lactobacillales bacterium]
MSLKNMKSIVLLGILAANMLATSTTAIVATASDLTNPASAVNKLAGKEALAADFANEFKAQDDARVAAIKKYIAESGGFKTNSKGDSEDISNTEVPVFVVLKDSSASEIIKQRPKTAKQLRKVVKQERAIFKDQVAVKKRVQKITNDSTSVNDSQGSLAYLVNGFATTASYNEMKKIEKDSSVEKVYVDNYIVPDATTPTTGNSNSNVQLNPDLGTISADSQRNEIARHLGPASALPLIGVSTGLEGDSSSAWGMGFTGKGMVVAVLDNQFSHVHRDLNPVPDPKLSKEDIQAKIKELGYGTYLSEKMPFGFNYASNSTQNIKDEVMEEQHGEHVAGIVGANGNPDWENGGSGNSMIGVAPDAQLLGMRIFADDTRGAKSSCVGKAMEDATKLGADIVNMSMGSPQGNVDYDLETFLLDELTKTGVLYVLSAGNGGVYSYGAPGGGGTMARFPTYEENTVGTPGVASEALTVAASNNAYAFNQFTKLGDATGNPILGDDANLQFMENDILNKEGWKFDQKFKFAYVTRRTATKNKLGEPIAVDELPGTLCPDEMTPDAIDKFNNQHSDAFAGKVVLAARGAGVPFVDKVVTLQKAGAKAVLLIDDQRGEAPAFTLDTTGTDLQSGEKGLKITIPVLCMTYDDGKAIFDQIKEDEAKLDDAHKGSTDYTLSKPYYQEVVANNVGEVGGFSSWGADPDLNFKPNIMGVGEGIYSLQNDDHYISMGGTSMSSPQVAGSEALILQALRAKIAKGLYSDLDVDAKNNASGNSQAEIEEIKNTTEVTAQVFWEYTPEADSGLAHKAAPAGAPNAAINSPRQQGAGLIQVDKAILNNTSIKWDANEDGKIVPSEYSPEVALKQFETGKTFSVHVKNNDIKEVKYEVASNNPLFYSGYDTPDAFDENGDPVQRKVVDRQAQGGSNINLKEGGREVTLAPGEEKVLTFSVDVNDAAAVQNFVEGFVTLQPKSDNAQTLNFPIMGFYGDFTGIEQTPENLAAGKAGNIFDPEADQPGTIYASHSLINSSTYNPLGQVLIGYKYAEPKKDDPEFGFEADNDKNGGYALDATLSKIPVYDVNPDFAAISPNGDGQFDELADNAAIIRAVKNLEFNILDTDGKLVKKVGEKNVGRKGEYNDDYDLAIGAFIQGMVSVWRGEIDREDGSSAVVDGTYLAQTVGQTFVEGKYQTQTKTVPIKVDTKAPVISNVSFMPGTANKKAVLRVGDVHDFGEGPGEDSAGTSGLNARRPEIKVGVMPPNGGSEVMQTYDFNSVAEMKAELAKGLELDPSQQLGGTIEFSIFDNASNPGYWVNDAQYTHGAGPDVSFDWSDLPVKINQAYNNRTYLSDMGANDVKIKLHTNTGKKVYLFEEITGNLLAMGDVDQDGNFEYSQMQLCMQLSPGNILGATQVVVTDADGNATSHDVIYYPSPDQKVRFYNMGSGSADQTFITEEYANKHNLYDAAKDLYKIQGKVNGAENGGVSNLRIAGYLDTADHDGKGDTANDLDLPENAVNIDPKDGSFEYEMPMFNQPGRAVMVAYDLTKQWDNDGDGVPDGPIEKRTVQYYVAVELQKNPTLQLNPVTTDKDGKTIATVGVPKADGTIPVYTNQDNLGVNIVAFDDQDLLLRINGMIADTRNYGGYTWNDSYKDLFDYNKLIEYPLLKGAPGAETVTPLEIGIQNMQSATGLSKKLEIHRKVAAIAKPVITSTKVDDGKWTNKPVLLHGDLPAGADKLVVSFDGEANWVDFETDNTMPVLLGGDYFVKAVDKYGNASDVVKVTVDKVQIGAGSTALIDATDNAEGAQTVTLDFALAGFVPAEHANAKLQYSLDAGSNWVDYTAPFEVSTTTTVAARVKDEAGNTSVITDKEVVVHEALTVESLGLTFGAHVQNRGDIGYFDGTINHKDFQNLSDVATVGAGTAGQGLRMESIKILGSDGKASSDIIVDAHVQNKGWLGYANGINGTSGQSLRVEAINLKLSDRLTAAGYHIYYCVHAQNKGWMNWVEGGRGDAKSSDASNAGTAGQGLRLEAYKVVITKSATPPAKFAGQGNQGFEKK